MARKSKPAPHVKERPINHFKGWPNLTILKLLNAPRLPYFRHIAQAMAKVEEHVLGGVEPMTASGMPAYKPGLGAIPLRQAPVIILPGRREQARRMKQMGRGAS